MSFSLGWVAAFPCLLTVVAAADFRGKLVVLSSAALSLGGAIGPGVAGLLKSGESYLPVLAYGGVSIMAGMLIFSYVLARLESGAHGG